MRTWCAVLETGGIPRRLLPSFRALVYFELFKRGKSAAYGTLQSEAALSSIQIIWICQSVCCPVSPSQGTCRPWVPQLGFPLMLVIMPLHPLREHVARGCCGVQRRVLVGKTGSYCTYSLRLMVCVLHPSSLPGFSGDGGNVFRLCEPL